MELFCNYAAGMNEEWKAIEGTNGLYEVSNTGLVCSLRQRPKVLTLTKQASGYLYAMIEIDGKNCNRRVHRLVAQAFLPNPDNLTEINHKDGNKENNQANNLEWSDRSRNMRHAVLTGLYHKSEWSPEQRKQIGERVRAYHQAHPKPKPPHRTRQEYNAERRLKAEARRAALAAQPKPPRKKWSAEARQRASERMKGQPHPHTQHRKGWKWSDEARERLRESLKGNQNARKNPRGVED